MFCVHLNRLISSGSLYDPNSGDQTNFSEESSCSSFSIQKRKEQNQNQTWNRSSSSDRVLKPQFHYATMSKSWEGLQLPLKEEISDSYIVFDASGRDGDESDVQDEDPLDKR